MAMAKPYDLLREACCNGARKALAEAGKPHKSEALIDAASRIRPL